MRLTALVLTAFVLVAHAAECPEHCDCQDMKTMRCRCQSRMTSLTIFAVKSTTKDVYISNCGEVFVNGSVFDGLTMHQFDVEDCGKVEFSNDAFLGMRLIRYVILRGISNLTLGGMSGFNSSLLCITDSVIERLPTYNYDVMVKGGNVSLRRMEVRNCTLNELRDHAFHMHPRSLLISESHIKSIGEYAFDAERKPSFLSLRLNKIDKIERSGLIVNGTKDVFISGNTFTNITLYAGAQFAVRNAEEFSFVNNTVVFNDDGIPEFTRIRGRLNFSGNNFLGSVPTRIYFKVQPREVIIEGNRYNCGCQQEWIWGKYDSSFSISARDVDVLSMLRSTSSCLEPKELRGVQVKDVSRVVSANGTCSRTFEASSFPEVSTNQPS